jgi:hypothetical protein
MKHPERPCTICMLDKDERVPATHVAGAADGMEWYECSRHGEREHPCGFVRTGRVPIAEWFRRVPGFGDN